MIICFQHLIDHLPFKHILGIKNTQQLNFFFWKNRKRRRNKITAQILAAKKPNCRRIIPHPTPKKKKFILRTEALISKIDRFFVSSVRQACALLTAVGNGCIFNNIWSLLTTINRIVGKSWKNVQLLWTIVSYTISVVQNSCKLY